MADPNLHIYQQKPALLGQEILARLEARDIAPTPEAYQALYLELTGQQAAAPTLAPQEGAANPAAPSMLEQRFQKVARQLAKNSNEAGMKLAYAIENEDWDALLDGIFKLVKASVAIQSQRSRFAAFGDQGDDGRPWQDQLAKMLAHTLPALLQNESELAMKSRHLAEQVKTTQSYRAMQKVMREVNELSYRISMVTEDEYGKQKAFIRLLNLTLDSLTEVIQTDDQVLHEVRNFQKIVNEPWDQSKLNKAAKQLTSRVSAQRA
ncbi:hypothetical protein [Methylovorus mays]|uniref:hypothetical protein n=1 Tax=Methylovorus mays TaxID=184077 RepID=UPI001E5B0A0E|nr:hypothetical protein [Methylovorus mays]MCB5207512.1 hypothetical protein [Methylovorus mays]